MAYSEDDDLYSRIREESVAQLADELNREDFVSTLISEADEEIDLYLRKRYDVPLSTVPGIVTGWSSDIAAYKAYARKPGERPDKVKDDYKRVVKMMEDVRDGRMDLPIDKPDDAFASVVLTSGDDDVNNFGPGQTKSWQGGGWP
jgi:phage gp36-like protein